jgi:hypothetical protein
MLRASLFWGVMLIIVGLLLGAQAAGLIQGNIWGYIWGLFLLGAGIWLLFTGFRSPKAYRPGRGTSVARKDAARASLRFEYGAGSLVVRGGAPADKILEGSTGTAMDLHVDYLDDEARVKFSAGPSWLPFLGPDEGAWTFQVNREIPLVMSVSGGACTADFDMTGVKLSSIRFETGASKIKLVLPEAAGETKVDVEGGASLFDLVVPQGVEARILVNQGASALDIDETAFPSVGGNRYESAGYGSAAHRAEIVLNTGAARIEIKRSPEPQPQTAAKEVA